MLDSKKAAKSQILLNIRITFASVSLLNTLPSQEPHGPQVLCSSYRVLSQSHLVLRFVFSSYQSASTESFRHSLLHILPPTYFHLSSNFTKLGALRSFLIPFSHLALAGKTSWTSSHPTYIRNSKVHYR